MSGTGVSHPPPEAGLSGLTPSEARCLLAISTAGSVNLQRHRLRLRGQADGKWLPFVEAAYLSLIGRGLVAFSDVLRMTVTPAGADMVLALSIKQEPPRSGQKSLLGQRLRGMKPGETFTVEIQPTTDFETAYGRVFNAARRIWGQGNGRVRRDLAARVITAERIA